MASPSDSASLSKIASKLVAEDNSFSDLVCEFLDGLPARLGNMQRAAANADFDSLHTLAHQLKGSGAGYGYPALSEHAARMEQDAAEGQLEGCMAALDELSALVPRLVVK